MELNAEPQMQKQKQKTLIATLLSSSDRAKYVV